jgi:type 1 glutamine amidotransferase
MDFARLRLLERLHETAGVIATTSSDFADIEKWLAGSTLLITYVAGPFPDEAQSAAIDAWLAAGGRWFALHGTSGGKATPVGDDRRVRRMVKMRHHESLGCFFLNHPPLRKFRVDVAPGPHPLLRDLPSSFEVADELYLLEILDSDCQPLLTTKLAKDPSPAGFGFVYDEDAGRPEDGETRVLGYEKKVGAGAVAYVALGHCHAPSNNVQPFVDESVDPTGATPASFRGAWENPAFDQLLQNAIVWGTSR